MDRIDALRAFIRIVETGSLSRAAFAHQDWPRVLTQADQEPRLESKPKLRRRA